MSALADSGIIEDVVDGPPKGVPVPDAIPAACSDSDALVGAPWVAVVVVAPAPDAVADAHWDSDALVGAPWVAVVVPAPDAIADAHWDSDATVDAP
ncbi:MAG: hypothetical protein FWF88_05675 [Peptococcaceae bacterium]|nr:hypothetical protein [Peptococcaceae bacterium]